MSSSPIRRQQTKQRFTSPEGYLSRELGRAVEKPLPLFNRLLTGGICLIFTSAIAGAALCKVDKVATAEGEILPSSRVQPIHALSGGLIRQVNVKEGDRVKPNDVLLQLDPTLSESELKRLDQLVKLNQEKQARLMAELTGEKQSGDPFQDQLLDSRQREYEQRRTAAEAEANRQIGVIKAAEAEQERIRATLDVAQKREARLKDPLVQGAIPLNYYEDVQLQIATAQQQIQAQVQLIEQATQAYNAAQAQLKRLAPERQNEILGQLEQQNQELASLKEQQKQAKEQRDRETIKTSIAGTVYNLKVNMTGATIQSGQELLSIIPPNKELILEAKVRNQDIGFIDKIGKASKVKVKIATFPYQDYGHVEGEVFQISPNAVSDPELGLIFPVQIKLNRTSIKVDGNKEKRLIPGMVVTADIVLRQETILSSILSPIIDHWNKGLSVR